MGEYDGGGVEKSAWNLSQQLIFQMNYLLARSSTNFVRGNIQGSYFDAEEIHVLLYNDISPKEDAQLDDWGRKICRLYHIYNTLGSKPKDKSLVQEEKNRINRLRNKHAYGVKRFRMKIIKLLGKYGYLVQKKADYSKMF